jgi:hypothetical protein
MKKLFCISISMGLCLCKAQTLTITKTESGNEISFRFLKEINISYYVIEGADDSTHYEIIDRIDVRHYNITPPTHELIDYRIYPCYRIRQISMSGSCTGKIAKCCVNAP